MKEYESKLDFETLGQYKKQEASENSDISISSPDAPKGKTTLETPEQRKVGDITTYDDVTSRIDDVLSTNEYKHFETEEARLFNQRVVEDYAHKKRIADLAMLKTQRETLIQHRDYIDQDNLERFYRDFDTDKLELFDSIYFENRLLRGVDAEKRNSITGFHGVSDGRICLRDSYDAQRLAKVSTHETFHDLSYHQYSCEEIPADAGDGCAYEKRHYQSGLHTYEKVINKERMEIVGATERGRAINEGFTEMLAQDELARRGEKTAYESYTQQVMWSRQLRYAIGDSAIDKAYFTGSEGEIRLQVERLTGRKELWDSLVYKMDQHMATVDSKAAEELRNEINEMVNTIMDGHNGRPA